MLLHAVTCCYKSRRARRPILHYKTPFQFSQHFQNTYDESTSLATSLFLVLSEMDTINSFNNEIDQAATQNQILMNIQRAGSLMRALILLLTNSSSSKVERSGVNRTRW